MAGLAVRGDPNGWLDAGRSVSTLAARLEGGLSDADAFGAQALGRSWYGPAASAFSADWSGRRSRYEDLIYHVRRAGSAITAYGQKLADMARLAAGLEATYCGLGLHILESGEGFGFPPGIGLMSPGTQVHLAQALATSVTDVAKLGSDALTAAEDLGIALGAATLALLDFELMELGALRTVVTDVGNELADDFRHLPSALERAADLAHEGLVETEKAFTHIATNARALAAQMSQYLREGTAEERSLGGRMLPQAGRDARTAAATADRVKGIAKWGGPALVGITAVSLAWEIKDDARQKGYLGSIESHSGDIASLALTGVEGAAGAAIAGVVLAGAPEAVVAVGAVAVTAVVAVGVGDAVQAVVDHRKAIVHFAEKLL